MLHNLTLLTNEELIELFVKESQRFMEGLDKHLPFKAMQDIRNNLKSIKDEMDKRVA